MSKDITEKELLPCPFCGKNAELITRGNDHTKKRSAEVECSYCHIKQITGAIRNSIEWCKEIAIHKWNKRAWQAKQSNQLDGWVSVEDRLPTVYTTCLIVDAESVEVAIYLPDGRWEDNHKEGFNHVTNWQPLPPPPQK